MLRSLTSSLHPSFSDNFALIAGDDSSLSYAWEEVGGSGYEELGTEAFTVRIICTTRHCSSDRSIQIEKSCTSDGILAATEAEPLLVFRP